MRAISQERVSGRRKPGLQGKPSNTAKRFPCVAHRAARHFRRAALLILTDFRRAIARKAQAKLLDTLCLRGYTISDCIGRRPKRSERNGPSMLSLSKKTDYALLALSYLTRAGESRAVNTKEIAEQYAIPVELLAKILQKLAKAQLVVSTPGPTGGYRLARPAAAISIATVIQVVDGPPAIA